MRIERLVEHHSRAAFESGNDALDTWFRTHAKIAEQQDTARTFVLIDDAEGIIGYYGLAMGGVEWVDAPRRLTRALRFPVPTVLLARLARGAFRASFGGYALTRKLKLPSPTDRANVRITRGASSKGPCV